MAPRRKLALRQIDEPEVIELSDGEDAAHRFSTAEPNFSLLPAVNTDTNGARHRDAIAPNPQHVATVPEAVDDAQPTKRARTGERNGSAAAIHSNGSNATATGQQQDTTVTSGVFALYQDGLCPDHTLRLHFIRRRPPPPPSKRAEEQFVLPRPAIHLTDLLPPLRYTLNDLLRPRESAISDRKDATSHQPATQELHDARESASTHWSTLASTPTETKLSWRVLHECDWLRVFTQCGSKIPSFDQLISLLKTLRSSAFALFMWTALTTPLLARLHHQGASTTDVERFAAALLDHEAFLHMPAKAFRAQLRAKQLRAIDDRFGADAELVLINQFHRSRSTAC